MTEPTKPPKRDPARLTIAVNSPDELEGSFARTILRPSLSAGRVIRRIEESSGDDLTLDALVTELVTQCESVNNGDLRRGEAMLTAQAHTLDSIFGHCARRSVLNMGEYPQAADTYMRLALRAQSQCRATWETLAEMKNPRAVAFVRQANISAGPQQVNNGSAPEASRPRKNENKPNKLLEAENERMDTRAAALAGRGDPALAPVGEIDGAAKRRG